MILCGINNIDCEHWVYKHAKEWRWQWEYTNVYECRTVGVWLPEDDAIMYKLVFGL